MTIEKFHDTFWDKDLNYVHNVIYTSSKHETSTGNYGNASEMTEREINKIYNSIDFKKYHKKKFTMGDYTFFGYYGEVREDDGWGGKKNKVESQFTFLFDYHGYRFQMIKFEKEATEGDRSKKNSNSYDNSHWGVDGFTEMIELVLDNEDSIKLVPYKLEEVFGTKGVSKGILGNKSINPPLYPLAPHPEYDWGGIKIGKIDIDHFVLLETKDGVYKPSAKIVNNFIHGYNYDEVRKPMEKKLSELGVHKVHFRNNASFSIDYYYDLEGIEVKASKSVLSSHPELRKYSTDDKAKSEIAAKEKAAEEARQKEIYDDTYTLMHHGKVIAENVRSGEITEYFDNKESKEFEFNVIDAGKKCFDAAPELDRIFFMNYGIYSYTEMSGEKFTHYEDLEYVNKLKDIKLPKRLVTLLSHCEIEPPAFDTDSDLFEFDKGAMYIGAAKDEDGEVYMIHEDGDQGI